MKEGSKNLVDGIEKGIEKQWDNWKCTMLTQVTAQDVADVLDPSYTLTTLNEMRLFVKKQKYMYAILEKNIQMDTGKHLVHEHLYDYNAQEVSRSYWTMLKCLPRLALKW